MNRYLRFFALFVSVLGLTALGGYLYLSSAAGGQWAVRFAQKKIADLGYNLTAESLQFDIFNQIRFSNLHLSKVSPDSKLDAFVAHGEITYRIGLFPLALDIQKFQIDAVDVKLETTSAPPTETQNSSELSLASTFRNLFRLVPMDIRISALHIGPVTAKVQQRLADLSSEQQIEFSGLTVQGSVMITSQQIRTDLKLQMPEDKSLLATFRKRSVNPESQLQLNWQASMELKVFIENLENGVRFQPERMLAKMNVENFAQRTVAAGAQPPKTSQLKVGQIEILAGPVSAKEAFHWQLKTSARDIQMAQGAGTFQKIPTLQFVVDLETNEALKFLRAGVHVSEGSEPVLVGRTSLLDDSNFLNGDVKINLNPQFFSKWQAVLPSSMQGKRASEVQAQVEFSLDLPELKPTHLLAIPWPSLKSETAQGHLKLAAKTVNLPTAELLDTLVEVKWSQKKSAALSMPEAALDLDLHTTVQRAPGLPGPLPLALTLQVPQLTASEGRYDLELELQKQSVLKSQGAWKLRESDHLVVQSKSDLETQHLPSSLSIFQTIKPYGLPTVSLQLDGEVAWPLANPVVATNFKGKLSGEWQRTAPAESLDPGSGEFQMHLTHSRDGRSIGGRVTTKKIQKLETAALGASQIDFQFQQSGPLASKEIQMQTKGELKGIQFLGAHASLNSSAKDFTSLEFDLAASGTPRGLELTKAKVTLGKNVVNLELSGKALFLEKELQIEGQAGVDLQKQMTLMGEHKLRGHLTIPVAAYVRANEWINVSGQLKFSNFDYAGPKFQLQSISGFLPFQEQLQLKNRKFVFTELLQLNTFTRVTFDRVEPLLMNASPLVIKKIVVEDKTYGPLVIHGLLRQNLLLGQKLDLSLGQGQLGGEFYFDFYPRTLSFGLLTRLTNVRPDEVLPKSFRGRGPVSNEPISARTAIVYEINSRSLEGKIDVTQIGQSQLLTLINVMDPEYRDDRLNQLRTVLGFAYPTSVAAQFSQGYMDFDVALNIGKPIPKIRGVAVSPFLTDISRKIRNQVKEVTVE